MNSRYIKLILGIIFLTTLCEAGFISNLYQKFQNSLNDSQNYRKVVNIRNNVKFNQKRYLDVYYNKDDVENLKPVVIHVYGGIWIKGHKEKFTKIGSLLETNDYVAVLPNYGLFPSNGFIDMVHDVYTSITWTYHNIQKYGGDPNRITLVGHSAGAHLIALTLFKSYLLMDNDGILEPLPHIEKIILLAGPYNFDDFSLVKKYLGVEVQNSLFEQLVKVLSRSNDVSPHDIVADLPNDSISDGFNVDKFVFYYTSSDEKVSESSALDLIKEMKRVCKNCNIEYIYQQKPYCHSEIVNGIRRDDKIQKKIYMNLLKKH